VRAAFAEIISPARIHLPVLTNALYVHSLMVLVNTSHEYISARSPLAKRVEKKRWRRRGIFSPLIYKVGGRPRGAIVIAIRSV
jgi:hypothetical protein